MTSVLLPKDCKHRPGVYVPQLEDDVVYIWNGHKQFLDNTNAKGQGPWAEFGGQEVRSCKMFASSLRAQRSLHPHIIADHKSLKFTQSTMTLQDVLASPLRSAEPCRVVSLHYTIALDSAADTFATVRLQLTDAASPLCGKEFDVEIPPSHLGQAEFVIAKSRFEVSARRGFAVGERCKVCRYCRGLHSDTEHDWCRVANDSAQIFYPDEGERGQWWQGTILTDRLQEAASSSREDPYAAALWERYTVVWDEEVGALVLLSCRRLSCTGCEKRTGCAGSPRCALSADQLWRSTPGGPDDDGARSLGNV